MLAARMERVVPHGTNLCHVPREVALLSPALRIHGRAQRAAFANSAPFPKSMRLPQLELVSLVRHKKDRRGVGIAQCSKERNTAEREPKTNFHYFTASDAV